MQQADRVGGMRLALVSETCAPEVNGVALTLGHLLYGLRQRGHWVELVRPRQLRGDRGGHGEFTVAGLPLPGYAGLRFGLPAGRILLQRWREQRPDLVHVVTEGPLGWSAVSAARRLGIPVTSGYHTNFARYSLHYRLGWLRPAVASYLRGFHRRTQATLVPTAALAAELAGEGVPGVQVVGRGVDSSLFGPQRRNPGLRHLWGAGPDDPVCLFVSRLAPEKNLADVVRAFVALRQQQPAARMVWVGDGPARAALQRAHPEHVFCGEQRGEKLAEHYASADLFLFPSLSETWGNVVGEAMASGLPVLAYRSAAAAELIVDGTNGRVVAPGDSAAFVTAAGQLAADPVGRRRIGQAARESVQQRGWSEVVARFEGILRQVIGGG
ncbi:glycosyltransferase family 1 protein [Dechloromonas sp. ZY10]|uniref:glycosyltransferase family 4 protein n=1 Tax=Dechloromonas aquae TaxID=2664436 RepID=UPI0035299BE9